MNVINRMVSGKIKSGLSIAILFSFLTLFAIPSNGQDSIKQKEPWRLSVSAGDYSCLDLWASTVYANVILIPSWKVWVFRPQLGALVSWEGSYMLYAGLVWPARPVKGLLLQTGAAAGYYENGNGLDLCYPLEFRLSFAVMYQFKNGMELGAEVAHISNADLGLPNPGTESISVMFQFPLRKMMAY